MSIGFASYKHLKLPISIEIPVTVSLYHNCLYLHDSYISKFDFMNFLFANMVLAQLYQDKNST